MYCNNFRKHLSLVFRIFNSLTTLTVLGPAFFSSSPGLERGGGEGGSRGPDAIYQSYHHLIKIKLCMSHYSHKGMPDANFESGSFSIFGDFMSQKLPLRKETSHQILVFSPENGLNLKKRVFMSRIVHGDPN